MTRSRLPAACLFFSFVFSSSAPAFAQRDAALIEAGPMAVQSEEYRFAASSDELVLAGKETEIWAQVTYPKELKGPYPLLLFLHGNHPTCQRGSADNPDFSCDYTDSGTCPAGYEVVPNHLGYSYAAEHLASWGFVVVSINANRGITCGEGTDDDSGLNLARGRLVLRHLALLAAWNAGRAHAPLKANLTGKLDLQSVGLMGHSRGGEGVRAAYALYSDANSPWPLLIGTPVKFRAIFEIAPVDGQTHRVLNAPGVAWNVMLAMCDGDVFDLEGIRPLDRMLYSRKGEAYEPKTAFLVWGANHNYFNTVWTNNDSTGCTDHKPIWETSAGEAGQRQVGLVALDAFFRAHMPVESQPTLARPLNPSFPLPASVTQVTKVDRNWVESPSDDTTERMEGFDQPTGVNSYGFTNEYTGVEVSHKVSVPEHDPVRLAASVTWKETSASRQMRMNWAKAGSGRDVSGFQMLEFDLARSALSEGESVSESTDFSVILVDSSEHVSATVKVTDFANVAGPVGHKILQTVRVPLRAFSGVELGSIRSVVFRFDRIDRGQLYLSQLRFAKSVDVPLELRVAGSFPPNRGQSQPKSEAPRSGVVVGIAPADAQSVWLVVRSDGGFAPRAAVPELSIGDAIFRRSALPRGGVSDRLGFRVPLDKLRALAGRRILLRIGATRIDLGTLSENLPSLGAFR
jgi:hypothetical protein